MKLTKWMLMPMVALAICCGKGGDAAPEQQGGTDNPETPVDPPQPPVDETLVCVDAPLVLEFDSDVVLGTEGALKVFNSRDRQVDVIDLADAVTVTTREDGIDIPKTKIDGETRMTTWMDALKCGSRYRVVHYTPLKVEGKKLTVKLHSGVLDHNAEYYVTLDAGFVKDHPGLQKGDLTIKTKAKPTSTTLSVSPDGKSDFCTLQGAVNYAASLGRDKEVTIELARGTYNEMVFIRDKNNLTIKGRSRSATTLCYANCEHYEGGSGGSVTSKPSAGNAIGTSGGRSVMLVESCSNLKIETLTMKNTFGSTAGQAEVIYFNNDSGTLTITDCALHSLQDTFLCKGTVSVTGSLIAGHCDFIWGYPKVCIFDNCEIRAMAPGYVVQARVNSASDKGFIFRNCRFTADDGVADGVMYLARSAGQSNMYDNVTLINCTLGPVIAAAGWYTNPAPNPSVPTATSGWKEYGSKTPGGAAVTGHNAYGKVLTEEEARPYIEL